MRQNGGDVAVPVSTKRVMTSPTLPLIVNVSDSVWGREARRLGARRDGLRGGRGWGRRRRRGRWQQWGEERASTDPHNRRNLC